MSTPSTPHVSAITKLLSGLGNMLTDPKSAAVLGLAEGLGQAGAPHMLTPVPFGQALAQGLASSQAFQRQALANALQQQANLPFMTTRAKEFERAYKQQTNPNATPLQRAGSQALGYNIVSPGLGTAIYNNNPQVVAQRTRAQTLNQLQLIPANERAVILAKEFGIPAQGTVPEGYRGTSSGGVAPMGGAPGAIAANAYDKAGGAAAGSYPYGAALSYHTKAPGMAGGTLGGRPAPFIPVGPIGSGTLPGMPPAPGVGPSGGTPQPTPYGLAPPGSRAAESAAGARALPAVVGQIKAATGGRPLLTLPPRQPAGTGLFSRGESVGAYNAQQAVGKQTGVALENADKESAAARQQIVIYNELGQALQQMGPVGAWRDVSTQLGHIANYFGFTPFPIQSAAEFNKFRAQLVGAATKAVSPRASTQEMQFLAQSVPNYTLPGVAGQTLIGELRGLSQYQVIKANALPVYLETVSAKAKGPYRGTSLGWERWWNTHGPSPSAIVLGSVLTSLPPQEAHEYVQKLQGTVTGKHMIRQYNRALQFQAEYPGVFKGL